jgi:hypothetical protein
MTIHTRSKVKKASTNVENERTNTKYECHE